MAVDFSTTNYAISNNLGYEGNGFMSGVVSNPILFILIKLIGSMVIIFMYKICLEKNKKVAFIGMRVIILMMLFVAVNNLVVISANALSFNNFTGLGGVSGSVNTGNGYFDDEGAQFSYTGSRNVYIVGELTGVYLFEPISRINVPSPTYQLVNSSLGTIYDAVVSNGYVYFVDGTTLKKRLTRDSTSACESTDTTSGGCVAVMATGVGKTIRTSSGILYFTVGDLLKHLDDDGNVVTDFAFTSHNIYGGFAVVSNSGVLTTYATVGTTGINNYYIDKCTSSGCSVVVTATTGSAYTTIYGTLYPTTNYIYAYNFAGTPASSTHETLMYRINDTLVSVDYITTNGILKQNRAYVGGASTIGLWSTGTAYETYNSNEIGIESISVVPSEITYTTKMIKSLDSQYYNKSDIYLYYNVIINSIDINNILLDLDDYRWIISMTDPNGVTQDIIQTPECQTDNILDTSCQIYSTMGINAPSNGWLNGSWNAKLYEINIITGNRALITTSSSFTVLNTSLENQSTIPPPFEPPTSGTAPQAVSKIDSFVSWLGLGVNSVSKLLFAMIIIAIAATVGLVYGNGNIAMVFAFVPYAFFTFIDYIPKWIFIITILLIAIASKLFR